MSESTELLAYPREITGHANRKLAEAGQIPAVVYGAAHKTTSIAIDRHDFELMLAHQHGVAVFKLAIEGEKKPVNVVIKEVQRGPVKGTILHIDFQAVRMDQTIHATVPLEFVNDPAGVRAGGVLTVERHDLSIEALPGDLPESIVADIEALEVGDALLLSALTPPAGVTFLDDSETVLCSVTAPRVEVEEEVVAAEAVEVPEVGEEAEE